MIFGAKSVICKILQCARVAATAICFLGAFSDIALTLACASGDVKKVIRLWCCMVVIPLVVNEVLQLRWVSS
jgi:hypothetical protein